MKTIYATKKELTEYLQTSKRSNKIRRFWKHILASVPRNLYKEIRNRLVQLVEQNKDNYDITGVIVYKFEPQYSSKELLEYLHSYTVLVEEDTPEIKEWKKKVKLYRVEIGR